ncbi:MAG: ABC transporter ATP-binding protein [Gammaproteobacteria bacterium]|nr:ABC transporter ATP-binding protein [Gammaproteobacteria bacterium]
MTPVLATTGLAKRFGGLLAVDGVDFEVPRGQIRAVIGPNGAGKTTLMGLISGRLTPSAGRISFNGRDVTRQRAWDRARSGIVYTFQVTSIYAELSCYENVALAAQRQLAGGMFAQLLLDEKHIAERVAAALHQVGLERVSAQRADSLPYGHQRLLEVAMSLALEPQLLILDEPTQGLANAEIDALCEHVRAIAGRITVVIIEHNMPVVLDLADCITVMERGAVLAEGDPAQIAGDPQVQRAYLGA